MRQKRTLNWANKLKIVPLKKARFIKIIVSSECGLTWCVLLLRQDTCVVLENTPPLEGYLCLEPPFRSSLSLAPDGAVFSLGTYSSARQTHSFSLVRASPCSRSAGLWVWGSRLTDERTASLSAFLLRDSWFDFSCVRRSTRGLQSWFTRRLISLILGSLTSLTVGIISFALNLHAHGKQHFVREQQIKRADERGPHSLRHCNFALAQEN